MPDILGNGGIQIPLSGDDSGYNESVAGHSSIAESLTGEKSPTHENWLEEMNQERINAYLGLLQQNNNEHDALSMLKYLAKDDPEYKKMYLQLLAERENNADAWKRYEEFSNSYYQRSVADLKKAGLNPWLALQNLGSSGTGSISAAGTFSNPGTDKAIISAEATKQARLIGVVGVIIGALLHAMF